MTSLRSCLALSCIVLAGGIHAAEPAGKALEVPVVLPQAREVAEFADFAGRVEASQRAEVRARVTGYLTKANFRDGDAVKAGDVLFEIDSRPYRARLDRANAVLVQAEAQLKLADLNQKRTAAAFAQKAATQEELDKAVAVGLVARAELDVAKADRQLMQLDLEACTVRAPIAGHVGRRLVDVGNLIEAKKTNLAVIVTHDPMYVYFDIDERTLPRLRKAVPEGAKNLEVLVGVAGDRDFAHRGKVDFIDNQVNRESGTLQFRAVVVNKDTALRPGMFARVRLPLGKPAAALLVPPQAVLVGDGEKFVFVVNGKNEIEKRVVTLGAEFDGRRVIRTGLKANDRVVVGRLDGLRPGLVVEPKVQAEEPKPEPKKPDRDSPAVAPISTGPGIAVSATYPGASAQVVSDTVRAPIEQQVAGVEKARYLRSRCTNDGGFRLGVSFDPADDLNILQVLVQNRVALAGPALPNVVQNVGITIRKSGSGVVAIVTLFSPEGDRDLAFLTRITNTQVKDELARLAAVAEVSVIGAADENVRVQIDPTRLAGLGLTAADVNATIEKAKNQPNFDPKKLDALVLKTSESQVVLLRDVALVQAAGTSDNNLASFDGTPIVCLVVHGYSKVAPTIVADVKKKLGEIRSRLPKGVDVHVALDFADKTPECLLFDLDLPAGASAARVWERLNHAEKLARQVPGVQHTLAVTQNPLDPFGIDPCLLVLLAPKAERKVDNNEVTHALRKNLDEINDMTVRVRDLSGRFPNFGYPIDFALNGPERGRVCAWAKKVGERLGRSKQATDLWVSRVSAPKPQRFIEIDREAAAKLGVGMNDITDTLRVYAGAHLLGDFNRVGRTVHVQVEARSGDLANDLRSLRVRNGKGQMVALGAMVSVRETDAPAALDFLNSQPMVQVTANPAGDSIEKKTRTLCETLAEEVRKEMKLSKEYHLIWLQEPAKNRKR